METVIGNKVFYDKTYIMGILNVTPDSFSDGGKYTDADKILFRVKEMINQGTDIIDIGAESTRPGYSKISDDEEIHRLIPVLQSVKQRFDIPLSVDTYKYNIAKYALENGADMINDIWGFKKAPDIALLVKKHNAACCLMHNSDKNIYNDFFNDVIKDISESVKIAKNADIPDIKILIDGGVGFAKNTEQNLEIIKYTSHLKDITGLPVIVAASRKSVIGNILNTNTNQRLEGTLAITAYAKMNGAKFVRVHDIIENRHILDMLDAVINYKQGGPYG